MGTTKIDDSLLNQAEKLVKKNPIDYPSIKNVVDKAVRELIQRENL